MTQIRLKTWGLHQGRRVPESPAAAAFDRGPASLLFVSRHCPPCKNKCRHSFSWLFIPIYNWKLHFVTFSSFEAANTKRQGCWSFVERHIRCFRLRLKTVTARPKARCPTCLTRHLCKLGPMLDYTVDHKSPGVFFTLLPRAQWPHLQLCYCSCGIEFCTLACNCQGITISSVAINHKPLTIFLWTNAKDQGFRE